MHSFIKKCPQNPAYGPGMITLRKWHRQEKEDGEPALSMLTQPYFSSVMSHVLTSALSV